MNPHHTRTHTRLSAEEPVLSAGLVFKAWRLHSHLPCIVSGWWCKGISVRRLWTSLSSFDLIFFPHFNQYSAVSACGTQESVWGCAPLFSFFGLFCLLPLTWWPASPFPRGRLFWTTINTIQLKETTFWLLAFQILKHRRCNIMY